MDDNSVDSPSSSRSLTSTPTPSPSPLIKPDSYHPQPLLFKPDMVDMTSMIGAPPSVLGYHPRTTQHSSKYAQLLAVIDDLGKDIRPTYAGSKSSAERLKRGIVHARILVRECLMETERSARQ